MDLQEEINELNERIDAQNKYVKTLIDKLEGVVGDEFPQHSDLYRFINDEGVVYCTVYENHQIDRHRQSIGNFFQTEEQADFAVEKLKVESELREYSRPFEVYGTNYYLYFAKDDGFMGIACLTTSLAQGAIYFESEEKAQQAISTVGEDRIKKYIFGVED